MSRETGLMLAGRAIDMEAVRMAKVEMLYVEFNNKEGATYFIDKDKYSVAHRIDDNKVKLSTYNGMYIFDCKNNEVIFHRDGILGGKKIAVKCWKTYKWVTGQVGLREKMEITI